jgi:hypothetical protein
MRAAAIAVAVGLCSIVPSRADAKVQNTATGQVGVVAVSGPGFWDRTRLNLGVRFESVWFREHAKQLGIGPYLEARTGSFGHADYGGGLVAVLPTAETFPIWLGGGAFARRDENAFHAGYNGFIAWGSRSFNHHGSYGMVYGLMLDARYHRGPQPGVDVVLTATIDLQWLAYPWIIAYTAIRH